MNFPPRTTLLCSLAPLGLSLALAAQSPTSLLFAPRSTETTRSGSNGTALRQISERSIAVVTPNDGGN
ncbi:MAG: hypothetical protein KDC87_16940, partial [Planctomycetes bacterium]|nr:hypothetical protein [Planctomycetota bacterium]